MTPHLSDVLYWTFGLFFSFLFIRALFFKHVRFAPLPVARSAQLHQVVEQLQSEAMDAMAHVIPQELVVVAEALGPGYDQATTGEEKKVTLERAMILLAGVRGRPWTQDQKAIVSLAKMALQAKVMEFEAAYGDKLTLSPKMRERDCLDNMPK